MDLLALLDSDNNVTIRSFLTRSNCERTRLRSIG